MRKPREDQDGKHRGAFLSNKKRIYASQSVCGICGKPVDFSLKFPHPLSACIDHIIPIDRGGHPSDIENLQLAHLSCNRAKATKIMATYRAKKSEVANNRNLPQTRDWSRYSEE